MNTLRLLSKHSDCYSVKGSVVEAKLIGLIVMLLLLGQSGIYAQSITCRGNVEIGFGPWCKVNLEPGQFLSNPSGNYTFEIVGTDISGPLPYLDLQTSDIVINQVYDYTITNASGVTCDNGTVIFRDYSPPICGTFDPIVTTYCSSDDITAAFTGPDFSDCTSFTTSYVDDIEESCDFDLYQGKKVVRKITRSWSAIDAFGNRSNVECSQTLYVLSPDIADIIIEPIIEIACDKNISVDVAIDPNNLPINAKPFFELDGTSTSLTALCKYAVVKFDSEPVAQGGNKIKVFRNWQITNWCTSETRIEQQTIVFTDTIAPIINVPSEVVLEANVFSADPFKLCSAKGQLPMATASDNCSEDDEISISIFIPLYNNTIPNGGTLPVGLPLGDNIVVYTATDACGVTTKDTVAVKVVDTTKPVAVCTPTKNVGITTGSNTWVSATEFENGSVDNCCIDRYEVRRADAESGDGAFGPAVSFNCDDDVVTVIFRVYDCSENFNDCTLQVTVQDLIIPTIAPPAGVEDYCTNVVGVDLTLLSVLQDRYGVPVVSDNCAAATFVENAPIVTQLDCQGQDITRRFYGVDAYGNLTADTVTQLVKIIGVSNFEVVFPESIEIDCSNAIPTTPPVVENKGCGELFTRYSDVIYNQDEGACYKLIRTWEVLDWCAFDVNQTNDGSEIILDPTDSGLPHIVIDGYVKYIQEIRVSDSEAPVINNAPADIEVNLVNDCSGFAIIPNPVVSDNNCNGNLEIIASVNGLPVIIGDKIFGTVGESYTIEYYAVDGCQNQSNLVETTVTFVDNIKPTPVCLSLSTELGAGGEVLIWANDFESGSSYDNCGLREGVALINKVIDVDGDNDFLEDVILTPPTGQTSITFTCADEGNQFVQYWIQDVSGNWEFCVTGIFITDADDDDCSSNGGAQNAYVSGRIQTVEGVNIEQVEVQINNPSMPAIFTGFDGFFNFIGLGTDQEYTVTPKKDIADANGISTIDMVILQRHVLGISELDSPYKMLAADVNNSGTLSTGDILEMRKLILGINTELTKTDSWRFIPEDYQFADSRHPFDEQVDGSVTAMSNSEIGFIGYKMGDLNLNANVSNLLGDDTEGEMELWLHNESFVAGEQISISLHAAEAAELLGLGLEIAYDDSMLSFEGIQSAALDGLVPEMYYDNPNKNGSVTLAWYDAFASTVSADDELVKIFFTALSDSNVDASIEINPSKQSTAVFSGGADLIEKNIVAVVKDITSEIKLYQNQPNPFTDETIIRFDLVENDYISLDIIDISGKLVYNLNGNFSKGENQVLIRSEEIPDAGIYYYRLRSGDYIETKKLIHIK